MIDDDPRRGIPLKGDPPWTVLDRGVRRPHRCSMPGLWQRWRLGLGAGALVRCECGQDWQWAGDGDGWFWRRFGD